MTHARTSRSHPLQIAEVRASQTHGRIGITFCPGKHDPAAITGAWTRDLAQDLDVIADWGAKLVLTLIEPRELRMLKVPQLGEQIERRGIAWRHLPITDYSTPSAAFERAWLKQGKEIRALLREGSDVVVHCRGGLGRAGMIAARLLVELGMPAEEAIREVRQARRGAIETAEQLALVRRTVAMEVEEALLDTASLRRVGGQLGSNPAGSYEDESGRRFYVKWLESSAHARNELLAAKLYQLAGAPTLKYVRVKAADQIATELVQLDKKHVASLTESERRQAQQWLGVHAWTANWDAAGFTGDNQGVLAGTVITLDVGGALEFRGQGIPKGRAFGSSVDELDSLRTRADNPHAVRLFGDMSAAQLVHAVEVVAQIPDERIRQLLHEHGASHALAEKLIARKADMLRRVADLRGSGG